MERIFGIDIGTTSIGFAVIDWDEAVRAGEIQRLGVRIFPEGVTEDKKEPRNKARRAARLLRRQIRRRRYRRKEVGERLAAAGLLPRFGTPDWHCVMAADPYALRSRGLSAALAPFDVGRAIYHLVKRAGFALPRQLDADAGEDPETGKVVKPAIEGLRQELGERTLGEYLAAPPDGKRRRNRYIGRDMVLTEFDRLWRAQAEHHPAMTEELRSHVFGAAFFRRPTYWRLDTLGTCRFAPKSPLCATGSWLGQRTIMLEKLNSLRLAGGNARPLMPEEREIALRMLERQRSVKFTTLRNQFRKLWREIGTPREALFNFEIGGRNELPGNATEAALVKVFGVDWDPMAEALKERIRAEIFDRLHDAYYRRVCNQRIEIRKPEEVDQRKSALVKAVVTEYDIDSVKAKALAELSLPAGWRRVSVEAAERMLPFLEQGDTYNQAVEGAFGVSHSQAPVTGEVRRRLPSRPECMPDVRNPTVNRALNELRKVVNNLLAAHPSPSVIRIELARDLRLPKRRREQMDKDNRAREAQRKDAIKRLAENNIHNPEKKIVDKYLLWQETTETCPYTGRKISFDQLFRTGEFDVEHIVPRSRSLDNGFGNKTLCEKQVNITKGNQTPYEFFRGRPDEWARVQTCAKNVLAGNPAKLKRFLREDWAGAETEELAERQLRDTAYIAREARDFLKCLDNREQPRLRVETCNGRVTAQLRDLWCLNSMLGDTGEKNRADHRHHAVDAVAIALATPAAVKRLSDHYAAEVRLEPDRMPLPWATLRQDVEHWVAEIKVSYRVAAKTSGRLHEEMPFGLTPEARDDGRARFVKRKPVEHLSPTEIREIRDAGVRRLLEAELRRRGLPPDAYLRRGMTKNEKAKLTEALKAEISWPSSGVPIRKVRVYIDRHLDVVFPVNRSNRSFADKGPGTLHHIAIFASAAGAYHRTVDLAEVARRKALRQPIVRRDDPDGGRFVMSLCRNDILELCENGQKDYFVVRKFNESGRIFYKSHTAALMPKPEVSFGPSRLADPTIRKVSIDPIGRVRSAND